MRATLRYVLICVLSLGALAPAHARPHVGPPLVVGTHESPRLVMAGREPKAAVSAFALRRLGKDGVSIARHMSLLLRGEAKDYSRDKLRVLLRLW